MILLARLNETSGLTYILYKMLRVVRVDVDFAFSCSRCPVAQRHSIIADQWDVYPISSKLVLNKHHIVRV